MVPPLLPTAGQPGRGRPQHHAPRSSNGDPLPILATTHLPFSTARSGRLLHRRAGHPARGAQLPGAAATLRIGRNQLYQAVARGQLDAVRIGRSIRIPKQALLDLLASASAPPASSDE
jgi:excisionase family DNA binding protein